MTTTPDDNGAMAVPGAAGHAAPPHRDPDLQAQVWAILDAAIECGEEPPSARAIRPMVRRNNSQVLRLIAAWQEERRTRPLVPGAVATLVVPIPRRPPTRRRTEPPRVSRRPSPRCCAPSTRR